MLSTGESQYLELGTQHRDHIRKKSHIRMVVLKEVSYLQCFGTLLA